MTNKRMVFYKNSSLDNHLITINSMLSHDYKILTKEEFDKCLEVVPKINEAIICKRKCDNEENYKRVLDMANVCLKMALIERRLGLVKHEDLEKKYS